MNDIKEQLVQYCGCVEQVDDEDVKEVINLVSTLTCWADAKHGHICDTFLNTERCEIHRVTDMSYFHFTPFYKPFDLDTFTFTLLKVSNNGIEEVACEYWYNEYDEVFNIKLPENCDCMCSCDKADYRLKVVYYAGYPYIPECILPIMCDLVQMVHAKRSCDCECTSCSRTSNPEDSVTYAKGDFITATLQNDELKQILVPTYVNMLGKISLCNSKLNELWGKVI